MTSDAARAGGRIASAQARNLVYHDQRRESVAAALRALPYDAPEEMWVYRANGHGYPGAGRGLSSSAANCIRYVWNPEADRVGTSMIPLVAAWTAPPPGVR